MRTSLFRILIFNIELLLDKKITLKKTIFEKKNHAELKRKILFGC